MHRAVVLVRNFTSPAHRLDFGEREERFSLSDVNGLNLDQLREVLHTRDVYRNDWVLEKNYDTLPPGPPHSPAGVGGIPNDIEDLLFLFKLYKVGDISFARQAIIPPEGGPLIQAAYRFINEGHDNSIFTTEMTPDECNSFMEFANALRQGQSWHATWFEVARRFFLYGGAKEFSPRWDEVDRIVDYATGLEAVLTPEMDFSSRRTRERASLLLKERHDPERVRQVVSKLYDIRSKIVHGTPLSNDSREWLYDNCGDVELVVRNVLIQAIMVMPPDAEQHEELPCLSIRHRGFRSRRCCR